MSPIRQSVNEVWRRLLTRNSESYTKLLQLTSCKLPQYGHGNDQNLVLYSKCILSTFADHATADRLGPLSHQLQSLSLTGLAAGLVKPILVLNC
jgi:hypothetical protein